MTRRSVFNGVILIFSIFCCGSWEVRSEEQCLVHFWRPTCSIYGNTSYPYSEQYYVEPSPVQFTIEPQDLVFFDGSDITLYCETNCVQLEFNDSPCTVGFLYNGCSLDYFTPHDHSLSEDEVIGRRSLTIYNANSTANGIYHCYTYSQRLHPVPLTDRIIGRPIHLQIAALESVGEESEIQIVNVSEGGRVELPCMKGVFPNPSNISWWRNDDLVSDIYIQENIEILPNGDLVLTNFTSNMSGDTFYCEIGWDNHESYNATYQIFVDTSMNLTEENLTEILKPLLKSELPTVVTLNAIIDYVSEGNAMYYKSDLLVDLQKNSHVDDYLINVTITCTFSGHPRPQVKWFHNGLNISECINGTSTIATEGNTSILFITTTNPKSYFGSYQCMVVNEAGYASNTTRILPKGWSNRPKNLTVRFSNTDIILRWGPPEYTGGEAVQYYRVGFTDLNTNDNKYLETKTTFRSIKFGDIQEHYINNGDFYVKFTVEVVNTDVVPMSSASAINLDSRSKDLQPEIRNVDCTWRNVTVEWFNHNHDADSNIWDYCIYYNCSTMGGAVTGELCTPEIRRGYFKSLQRKELDNVPLNGTCSFRVMVFTDGYNYRWSNFLSCTRNISLSVVTSKIMDQSRTEGDIVEFTCQATSELIFDITWFFNNNNIPVNESDKYEISTKVLNYTSSLSTLTVKSVESSDVGTYTCYATNGKLDDKNSGILSVKVRPNATILETENITEGDNITCMATGHPEPFIVWMNNGSVVDKNRTVNGSAMAVGVGNVSIVSVSMIVRRNDDGAYSCVASNTVGTDTSTVNITVQYKVDENLIYEDVRSKSNVSIWIGVIFSVLLLVIILLLIITVIVWNRRMKYGKKYEINDRDMLKVLNEEVDYDKLPKDDISLVEIISIKSSDVLGMERASVVDDDDDYSILRKIQKTSVSTFDIFSFIDSEHDEDTDASSNCVSHDYYTSNKLRNSATTTGSTNVDSGIDSQSHGKFPE